MSDVSSAWSEISMASRSRLVELALRHVRRPDAVQHAHHGRLVAAVAGERQRALMDLLDLVGRVSLRHDDGDAARQQHAQLGLGGIVELGQRQHVDRLAVQPIRLDVGVAGQRIARRQLEVLHAAVVPARRLEADGELGGDVADVGAIGLFLARGDPALPFDAPCLGDAAAQPLLVHGVHEGIAVGDGAVGPVVAAAAGDELLALHQAIADLLDRLDVEPRCRGDRRGGELRAAHRRDLQHAPLLGGEVLDLLADQDLHGVGNGEADPRDRLGQPPAAVVPSAPLRTRSSVSATANSGLPSVRPWMNCESSPSSAASSAKRRCR